MSINLFIEPRGPRPEKENLHEKSSDLMFNTSYIYRTQLFTLLKWENSLRDTEIVNSNKLLNLM